MFSLRFRFALLLRTLDYAWSWVGGTVECLNVQALGTLCDIDQATYHFRASASLSVDGDINDTVKALSQMN